MGKKLLEKAGLIGTLTVSSPVLNRSTPPLNSPTGEPGANRPKTAPGTMLGFMSAQSTAIQELEVLKERLSQFDGASPVRPLDPAHIVPSRLANRHAASFIGTEFESLKEEIRQAGENVQAIKVRPKALNGSTVGTSGQFELIYGHRRHRACLELGLPVNAVIVEASDTELFEQMERENRGRQNLSAWEQGRMYRQALDEGLYPSLRKLAEAVSVDQSLVSKSIALARLPDDVVAAFESPLEIQYRWAQPLSEAQQKDPDGLLARAAALKTQSPRLPASKVFAVLSGAEALNASSPPKAAKAVTLKSGSKKLGMLLVDAQGRAVLRLEPGFLPESRRKAFAKLVEDFLREK